MLNCSPISVLKDYVSKIKSSPPVYGYKFPLNIDELLCTMAGIEITLNTLSSLKPIVRFFRIGVNTTLLYILGQSIIFML